MTEKEKIYRTLFESSRDAIMMLAPPDWLFTAGNPATIEMFKAKDEKQFVAKGPWELSPEYQPDGQLSSEKARKMIEKVMETGSHFFEWTHKRFDGKEFPATVLLTRMELKGKKLLQATVRDVTERKLAEKRLHESEELFRIMSSSVRDAILMLDNSGNITYWNDAAEKIFGYTEKESLGKELYIFLVPKKYHEEYKRGFLHFKETGQGVSIDKTLELTALKKGGEEFPIEMSLSAVKIKGLWNAIGIIRDITARKRVEEELRKYRDHLEELVEEQTIELRESKEQFQSLYENMTLGMYRTTPKGQIVMANPALISLLGYDSFEELKKRNLERNGFDPEYPREKFKEEIKKNGKVQGMESKWKRRDGISMFIRESANAIKDEKGNIIYYDGTVEDVTERKRAEEKLKQYQFMVESVHDAIFLKDLKSRYIIANDKTLEVFGLSREEVIGKNDYEVMPNKEEAKINVDDDQVVFKTGKPKEIIKHMTGVDGKEYWFRAIKVPHFDTAGNVAGLIGIARDITERKRAENALRDSEKNFRNIFHFVPESLLAVNNKIEVLNSNIAFEKLVRKYAPELNMSEKELRKKIISELRKRFGKTEHGLIEISGIPRKMNKNTIIHT